MSKVCLAVIYNHQYVDNIDKINKLYKGRFSKIYHLMPFYRGNREDVIPIHECSYQFQAYVSQAFDKIYSNEYDYYIFMGDDVLIRPDFNEDTMSNFLLVDEDTGFTARNIEVLNDSTIISRKWLLPSLVTWLYSENKEQLENMLPPAVLMQKKYKRLGIKCENPPTENKIKYLQDFLYINTKNSYFYKYWHEYINIDFVKILNRYKEQDPKPKYLFPFALGFSDFFVIPKKYLKEFAWFSGIFASARIFAEIAVPTALSIVFNKLNLPKGIEYRIVNYSAVDKRRKELPEKYGKSIKKLYDNWDDKNLVIHPVKYSMWDMDYEG